nr:PREDICTED: uncharacterized protein LOC109037750 [Bemisia tabaci]
MMLSSAVVSVALLFALGAIEETYGLHIPKLNLAHMSKLHQPIWNHSLHYGEHKPNEYVLYKTVISSDDGDYKEFPEEGKTNDKTITAIEIIDKLANGKSGFVYHYDGVGSKNATFAYVNNNDSPYKFFITVLAQPEESDC